MRFKVRQAEESDIGGDRHEDESQRAFASGRIIFLEIDPYENGPAAFSHGRPLREARERL